MKKKTKPVAECRDCTDAYELVAEFMTGEVDKELTRELLLHAQSCPNCARLLRSLKRLVHYCHLEPNREIPSAVREELWVTIRRELYTD
jgi:hypothetical protein